MVCIFCEKKLFSAAQYTQSIEIRFLAFTVFIPKSIFFLNWG